MNLLTSPAEFKKFIGNFDTFLLDCDGVIWHGDVLLPRVKETLDMLRKLGKRILFVSNNSTKSRSSYKTKFTKLGLEVSEDEIFGSAYATAYYLKHILKFPEEKHAYIIGESGICDEFTAEGIKHFGAAEDDRPIDWEGVTNLHPDSNVGAVVVGFDMKLNYRKIARAHVYLFENPDCRFIATNTDSTFPHSGRLFPGTGVMVAALTESSGRTPQVIGKPNQSMLDCIVDKYHLDRMRTCMVGDRLNTDILFGIQGGMKTLLVMTGVTTKKELLDPAQKIHPCYWADNFGDLADAEKA